MKYYFRLTRINNTKVLLPSNEITSITPNQHCTNIETSKGLIQVKEDILEIEALIEQTGVMILDTDQLKEFNKLPF